MKLPRPLLAIFLASGCLLLPASQAQASPVGDPVPSYAFDPAFASPGNCGSADIAYGGTGSAGHSLAVWLEPRTGTEKGTMVRAALIATDGQLASTPVDVSVEQASRAINACAGNPTVAEGPDGEFLVLWGHEDAGTADERIVGQIIDSNGDRSGTNFVVSDWNVDIRLANAAWSPEDNRYLVSVTEVWGSNKNWGHFIDRDGTQIGSRFILVNQLSSRWGDIAYGSGIWTAIAMGCEEGCYGPWGVTVDPPGGSSADFPITTGVEYGATIGGAIAYNDFTNEFLVAWGDCGSGSCNHYARRLDSSGVPIGEKIIVDETESGGRPDVASGGENGYLVTWHDWAHDFDYVIASQLGTDGQPIGAPETVSLPNSEAVSYKPKAAYATKTGCYVVAWNGNGNPNNPYSPPTDGANVWTRNWNPTGSEPCVDPPTPNAPTIRAKGKAGATRLRVKVECGGDAPCDIRLSGKQKGRKGKLVPKTVQVGANGKVVTLRYTGALERSLLERGGGKVRVTASQTDGGSAATTVLVRVSPSPVTG